MHTASKGFSLIELMIVVAIIAILAAIAIPAYQGFTVRAKLSEAIIAVSPVKTAVSEAYIKGGMKDVETFADAYNAIPTHEKKSKYVKDITVSRTSGSISVFLPNDTSAGLPNDARNKTLVYTPYNHQTLLSSATDKDMVDWVCASNQAQNAANRGFTGMTMGTLPAKYAPSECR